MSTDHSESKLDRGATLLELQGVEAALNSIANMGLGAAAEPIDALPLLARQSELLTLKAKLLTELGSGALAQESARAALDLLAGLGKFQSEEALDLVLPLTIDAKATLVGALIVARRLEEASKQLADLATEPVLSSLLSKLKSKLIEALDSQRREEHQAVRVELQRKHNAVPKTWSRAERHLDALAGAIAERIRTANLLVSGLQDPAGFQQWLLDRVSAHLQGAPPLGVDSLASEDSSEQGEEQSEGILEAQARGAEVQRHLFESPEMLHADQLRLGTNEVGSDEKLAPLRSSGGILGLPHPDRPGVFAYPRWQLEGGNYSVIVNVLQKLRGVPPWAIWNFFHSEQPVLHGLSPLCVLGSETEFAGPGYPDKMERLLRQFNGQEAAVMAAAEALLGSED